MARKCHVLCNGVPVYQDRDWLQSHRQSGLSVADIAERGGCSYHTVRKWLRRHDLNFLPEERNFKNGNKPWNDGVSGYHTSRVVTEAEKATIRKARSGPQSNFWQGGITPERALIGAWTTANAHMVHARNNFRCATCGSKKRLETHHIKPVVTHPHLARDVSNLTTLCRDCHHSLHGRTGGEMRRARGGGPLLAHPSQIISIRYLGEQPTYDISVAGQHHNFVADGLVVHNSINELSARYRELPEIYYLPEPENVGAQSTSSKQARDLTGERRAERAVEIACVEQHCQQAFTKYRELLASGWPRELARMVLPLNTYSHMFWKVNLRNLFHFMTLRSDAHAQHEIRVYSDAMRELIRPIVPISVAAWET